MKFALLGHPVAGSYGPSLFSAAYGGEYPYLLEDHATFEAAWQCFLDGYDGVNVTAPYKQDAFRSCLWLSEEARRCGAVNLVLKDGLRGYNTDVSGVIYALEGIAARSVLVVGTGGAARAAIAAAQMLGSKVSVWGRSPEKVQALCGELGADAWQGEDPSLVIYTLPGSAPVPAGLPFKDAVVLEAEYRRPQLAGIPCRQYISGAEWFMGQAVAGYSLFTGKAPDVPAMKAALERILQ